MIFYRFKKLSGSPIGIEPMSQKLTYQSLILSVPRVSMIKANNCIIFNLMQSGGDGKGPQRNIVFDDPYDINQNQNQPRLLVQNQEYIHYRDIVRSQQQQSQDQGILYPSTRDPPQQHQSSPYMNPPQQQISQQLQPQFNPSYTQQIYEDNSLNYRVPKPQETQTFDRIFQESGIPGTFYDNLTASPYAKQMEQGANRPLSQRERFSQCQDYLQRYKDSILNESESAEFKRKHTLSAGLGFGFAIMIPFTMVNAFSSKYDIDRFYPKLLRNILVLGTLGLVYHFKHQNQQQFHSLLIQKYFGQYSDQDILKFDIMMAQHRAALAQQQNNYQPPREQ